MMSPYLVGGIPGVLRVERLGKGGHSPRHFIQHCCYWFRLSSIHVANPKHWAFRDLMCVQTHQEFRHPIRQGFARWHNLNALHSGTNPSLSIRTKCALVIFLLFPCSLSLWGGVLWLPAGR